MKLNSSLTPFLAFFQAVQFVHPVEKISFISRDTTDRRAFGYIVEGEKNKFHFFGIKTGNAAEGLVLALRDLFQVVYDIKQKEKNQGKQSGLILTYKCFLIKTWKT